MNIKKLEIFLTDAKKNTYASGNKNKVKIFSDGTKEYVFNKGDFKYIDRYKGFKRFRGKEKVFKNNKIVWSMSYYGGIVSEIIPTENIYQFLQEALKEITKNSPFRGPNNFRNNDFKYINKVKGTIEKFDGLETIHHKEELVYKLNYRGGLID